MELNWLAQSLTLVRDKMIDYVAMSVVRTLLCRHFRKTRELKIIFLFRKMTHLTQFKLQGPQDYVEFAKNHLKEKDPHLVVLSELHDPLFANVELSCSSVLTYEAINEHISKITWVTVESLNYVPESTEGVNYINYSWMYEED